MRGTLLGLAASILLASPSLAASVACTPTGYVRWGEGLPVAIAVTGSDEEFGPIVFRARPRNGRLCRASDRRPGRHLGRRRDDHPCEGRHGRSRRFRRRGEREAFIPSHHAVARQHAVRPHPSGRQCRCRHLRYGVIASRFAAAFVHSGGLLDARSGSRVEEIDQTIVIVDAAPVAVVAVRSVARPATRTGACDGNLPSEPPLTARPPAPPRQSPPSSRRPPAPSDWCCASHCRDRCWCRPRADCRSRAP